ncbi:hypothetical protein KCV87_17820 [Actinosynnema pretiosum subsp. pretiosum]|uniref:Uncharacterized protein n=2 Tax=Actinosynnema TaxID=40566 RepID=C6WI59_ACTMD|nr:hypothetical protein [Actinosynnema mirum]ACU34510.1 hypothetical protein Amir_0543 [Actinosynnema mirum DSM 43827]AXX27881.1 hypothetical protein APASM_0516 [Actinosynnema pretiosum subsp. pretiosum]QUF01435.1 hypothetical protein KCV87_17820 [Actinosynnema pretiosum subsp. pretiosum]
MTSVAEVRLALEQVAEGLQDAYRLAREAQDLLVDAVDVLAEAGENHHEELVPPAFLRAREAFPDELELIVSSLELVQRLAAEL